MAAADRKGHPTRNSLSWDETGALHYFGMLSLHEVFEIVGSQLTETDVEALSFLLDETYSAPHPLDPSGWTVKPPLGDPDAPGIYPSPELLRTWRRIKPRSSPEPFERSCKPTSGPEVLLDLERRGYISDGNLEPLLQLLRVLTRHDLMPYVSYRKRRRGEYGLEVFSQKILVPCFRGIPFRLSPFSDNLCFCFPVSPERITNTSDDSELVCSPEMQHIYRSTEMPFTPFSQQQTGGMCIVHYIACS